MRVKLILVAVVVIGCTKNSNYCPGANPDNNCAEIDAPGPAIDAPPTGCGSDGECSGATAVCDTSTRACVACTTSEPGACTGTAPVCKQDACVACSSHSDCSSNVCLPDGSCGTDANVAYVDPGGTDNTSCTKATPCTKVAKALATAKPFLKFHGTTNEQVSINNQNLTVLADAGAQLSYVAFGTGPARPARAELHAAPKPAMTVRMHTIIESEVARIIAATPEPGESVQRAFDRKEQELRSLFQSLTRAESIALHSKLSVDRDHATSVLARLTTERRNRVLARLAELSSAKVGGR